MFKLIQKQVPNPECVTIMNKAVKAQQKILYLHTHQQNQMLTSVVLTKSEKQDGQLMVTVRECSMNQTIELSVEAKAFTQQELNFINYVFFQGTDAFIVYAQPFKIFFITKGQNLPIALIFKQQFSLRSGAVFQLMYPNLIIFGSKIICKQNTTDAPCTNNDSKLQIMQLNLETLQIKTISNQTSKKSYSPGIRHQSISVISDGRIYTFGGKDSKNRFCQKMIWVYDMEKGYWFALQMQYQQQQNFSLCQSISISSSKVLIINKNSHRMWILEVHQSKLTQVQDFQLFQNNNLCLKGELVNYSNQYWKMWSKEIKYFKKELAK